MKDLRLAFIFADSPALGLPAVFAPFCPKRITFSLPLAHAFTMWDFLECDGVRLGLLHAIFFLFTLVAIRYAFKPNINDIEVTSAVTEPTAINSITVPSIIILLFLAFALALASLCSLMRFLSRIISL